MQVWVTTVHGSVEVTYTHAVNEVSKNGL